MQRRCGRRDKHDSAERREQPQATRVATIGLQFRERSATSQHRQKRAVTSLRTSFSLATKFVEAIRWVIVSPIREPSLIKFSKANGAQRSDRLHEKLFDGERELPSVDGIVTSAEMVVSATF
ncbi:MAG: hypothetical protein R3C05_30850 [Pirellulaceae bacterium]